MFGFLCIILTNGLTGIVIMYSVTVLVWSFDASAEWSQ